MSEDTEKLLGTSDEEHVAEKWKQSKIGLAQFITAAVLIILTYIQYYAVIASLSLTWVFPKSYTEGSFWLFLFNLDFWEFAKILSNGYFAFRDYATKSDVIMNDNFAAWYSVFAIIHWGVFILAILFNFIITKNASLKQKWSSRIRMGLIIFWYTMSIPVGVNYSKVYWCLPRSGIMDVSNKLVCLKSLESKIYMIISSLSLVFHFILVPIYYASKIRKSLVTPYVRAHENYLLRRELEVEFDLNSKFFTQNVFYFSLFRRKRSYYVISETIFRVGLIISYCAFFSLSDNENEELGSYGKLVSSTLIFILIFIKLILDTMYLPFRTFVLNILNVLCLIFLFTNSIMGLMLNIPDFETAFQSPIYLKPLLIFVNISWLVTLLAWMGYIIWKGLNRRLWPSLFSKTRKTYLCGENNRFVAALKEASRVIAETRSVVPLFAPAHKLKFQILKINALTREAEYYNELLHSTLQEALQILTELYSTIQDSSMFSGNASNMNNNQISEELFELIPDFTLALNKRDLDLALSKKVCKNAMLKVSAMAAFKSCGERQQFKKSIASLSIEDIEA